MKNNKLLLKFLTMISLCFLFSACDSNSLSFEETEKKISIQEAKKLILSTQNFSQSSDMEIELIEITSSDIWDKTKCQLFKIAGETFVVTNQVVFHIGNGFGGYGVTSAVPYDVNKDGTFDIVYTYSFGSGIHRSVISWIDLKNFNEHIVGDMPERTEFRMYDLILKIENNKIVVYRVIDESEILQSKDINHMTLKKDGILFWENSELYNKQLQN